jgi:hypothetical protein
MSSSTRLTRHSIHWDEYGDGFFCVHEFHLAHGSRSDCYCDLDQVGHMVYKLDTKILKRHSGMFRQIFMMPPAAHSIHLEGHSEDAPIPILHVGELEFDVFVSQIYGK